MELHNKILIAPYWTKSINHVNLKDETMYTVIIELILDLKQQKSDRWL